MVSSPRPKRRGGQGDLGTRGKIWVEAQECEPQDVSLTCTFIYLWGCPLVPPSPCPLVLFSDTASPTGMIASQVAHMVSEKLGQAVSAAQVNAALHELSLQDWTKPGSRERKLTPFGAQYGRVTTNPDIKTRPSFALMSRCSKVGWVKGLVLMSEFFLGRCSPPARLTPGVVLNCGGLITWCR